MSACVDIDGTVEPKDLGFGSDSADLAFKSLGRSTFGGITGSAVLRCRARATFGGRAVRTRQISS